MNLRTAIFQLTMVAVLLLEIIAIVILPDVITSTASESEELVYQTPAVYPLDGTEYYLRVFSYDEGQRTRTMIQIELWKGDSAPIRYMVCYTEDGTVSNMTDLTDVGGVYDSWEVWIDRRVNDAKITIDLPLTAEVPHVLSCSS